MLADDRQNIDAWIILMPQDFNNLPFSRRAAFRVIDDTNDNLFTVYRPFKGLFRDKNIAVNPLIIRQYKSIGLQALEYADGLQYASFDDTHYFTFHATA
ncbi:hypothetical protein D3C74_401670 [compost metagenome]